MPLLLLLLLLLAVSLNINRIKFLRSANVDYQTVCNEMSAQPSLMGEPFARL